jgi:hypothetical protein
MSENDNLPSAADLDTVVEEQEQAEQKPQLPICPHCGADPFKPAAMPAHAGQDIYVVYFCADCRKVITMGRIQQPPQIRRPLVELPGQNPTRRF